MKPVYLYLVSLVASFSVMQAELVMIEFEAEASTVVDHPFGIAVPRLTIVRGFLTYDSSSPDDNPGDLRRGNFEPVQGWSFRAEFLEHVLTGSSQAKGSTETFGHTLRFNDGGDREDTGEMAFDGHPNIETELGISIVGGPDDLPTVRLPELFKFQGAPHTFLLGDDRGRMLLQFRSFAQVTPNEIEGIVWTPGGPEITWYSIHGRSYQIEFSTDLQNWIDIGESLPAIGGAVSAIDLISDRYPENESKPRSGYYRVRDVGTSP